MLPLANENATLKKDFAEAENSVWVGVLTAARRVNLTEHALLIVDLLIPL